MLNEYELRIQALEMAKDLENHGQPGYLLMNSDMIYNYIINGLKKKEETFFDKLKITTPEASNIKFEMYDHQKLLLNSIEKSKSLIVNTARQLGTSTLYSAYAYKYASENPQSKTMIVTHKFNTAKYVLDMFAEQVPYKNKTQSQIELSNDSIMLCDIPSNIQEVRTDIDLLIVDNAAYISYKYDGVMLRLIESSKKSIVSSTPHERSGFFYMLWNTWSKSNKMMIPWHMNSEFTVEKANEIIRLCGDAHFQKEFCCQFV